MNQVMINKPLGGASPCIAAHYHKAGWHDVFSKLLPHPAVIVINDEPTTENDKPR